MRKQLFAFAAAAALSGCVTQMPQTAEEFRKAIPGAFLTKTDTYVVSRPLRDVAATSNSETCATAEGG